MAGCCRGLPRRIDNSSTTAECKTFESNGARTIVVLLKTQEGLCPAVATPRNGFVELASFLSTFKCNGPTARLLRRYLGKIRQALRENPTAFSPYRSGITITDLIRVAERATKGAMDAGLQAQPSRQRL
jgi:hypothetical protein